jgi:hypothetical protein
MSRVMIHPATYENVSEAVEQAFRLFPLDLREKKVFIKPNLLRLPTHAKGLLPIPQCFAPLWSLFLLSGNLS